jgi:adenosylcobinamide-GDP ribazoletransferase
VTGAPVRDALRLAFGTLTVLPVRPPSAVDRAVAGWAMALAPAVGAGLGVLACGAAWALSFVLEPTVVAVIVVTLVALSTRLIHWDGLADTADGLGSGKPAEAALDIMRRSDIGPFGVFAVLAVLAVQVAAAAALLMPDTFFIAGFAAPGEPLEPEEMTPRVAGLGALVAALVLGRCALLAGCRSGVPGARADGLGAAVAGSVDAARLLVGLALAAGVLGLAVVADDGLTPGTVAAAAAACVLWAVAATAYLRRRLGGMTGDTLGALVETTTAVALVVLSAGG